MADIEDVLGIRSCPMNWPIGVNGDYTGIYDRETEMCHLFIKDNAHGVKKLEVISGKMDDEKITSHLSPEIIQSLKDDLELLDEAGDPFDEEKVAKGELTPMFFGSAMTNFGVQPFLENTLNWHRRRNRERHWKAPFHRRIRTSLPSYSRSRPTWIPSTMTGWPSCVSAPASLKKGSVCFTARAAK